ncbi:lysozyme inhibitor LprI family protein [Glaciimonas sp. GG7]
MHKLLIGLLGLLPLTAFAQTDDPCVTQRNTIEINECGQKQFEQGDRHLNQSYQALLKRLAQKNVPDSNNVAIKQYLITAQRAWVTFRENDCKAVYAFNEGGSIRNIAYLSCMTEHTKERTKSLEAFGAGDEYHSK